MKNFLLNHLKFSLFVLFIVFSFMFMTTSLQILSSDYGAYYANAMFFNEKYSLYNEAFDHKGPIFYLFIKIIGSLFGWGGYFTFIPLFFSSFLFLLSFLYFLETLKLNKNKIYFLSVASIACLFNQSGNGSISFFIISLILFHLSFLIRFINYKKFYYYAFSALFLVSAILTRIDAAIFLILIIFQLIFFAKNLRERIMCLIFVLSLFILTFISVSIYFNFTADLFLKSNLIFNIFYPSMIDANLLSHFHKPESIKIFFASGVGVLLFIVINLCLPKIKIFTTKILGKKKEGKYFLSFVAALIFIFIFLIPKTEQSHYVLNLSIGSLILSSIFISFIDFKKILVIPLFLLFLYSILSHTLLPTVKFFKTFGCIESLSCSSILPFSDTIKDVSNYKTAIIIYGNGWINIFSKTAPSFSISNWPIFEKNKIGDFFRIMTKSDKLLTKNNQILWMDKSIYKKFENYKNKSDYEIIETQKSYLKIRVN